MRPLPHLLALVAAALPPAYAHAEPAWAVSAAPTRAKCVIMNKTVELEIAPGETVRFDGGLAKAAR